MGFFLNKIIEQCPNFVFIFFLSEKNKIECFGFYNHFLPSFKCFSQIEVFASRKGFFAVEKIKENSCFFFLKKELCLKKKLRLIFCESVMGWNL